MRKFGIVITALAVLATMVAPGFAQTDESIADIAVANGSFTTLVAAASEAGLVDTLASDGPFTVFAPTDAAFAQLLDDLNVTAEELLANKELLTSVLTYHVVPGKVMSSDIPGLFDSSGALFAETVNGSRVKITQNGSSVYVNYARVTAADIEASNGVIHVIDRVILPPSFVVQVAQSNNTGQFDTLLAAAEAAGVVDALSDGGPFTILAPTDDAFAALLSALGVSAGELLANTELLTSVLTYHVIPGEFLSGDITAAANGNGTFEAPTLNGDTVTVTVNGGFISVDGATVVAKDIVASNGVIHVISKVILPG